MATYSPYRVKSIVYKAFMGIRDKSEKANIEDPYVEMSMNLVSWKLRALGIRSGQKRLKQYTGNKKIILSLGSGGSNSLNGRLVGDEIWAVVKDNTHSKKPRNIPWSDWNGGGNWVDPWSDARLAIKCSDITVPDYAERVPNAENIIVNQLNYMQCLQTDCSRIWSLMGRVDGYPQKSGAGSVVVPLGDSVAWIDLCYDSPANPPPPPSLPPPPAPTDPDGGDIIPSPNPYRCPKTLLNVTYPSEEAIYIMLDVGYSKHEESVNFSASYQSWSKQARMWIGDGEEKMTFDYDETFTGDFGCSHFHGFAGKITVEEGLPAGKYERMLTCKVFDEEKKIKVVVIVGAKKISLKGQQVIYNNTIRRAQSWVTSTIGCYYCLAATDQWGGSPVVTSEHRVRDITAISSGGGGGPNGSHSLVKGNNSLSGIKFTFKTLGNVPSGSIILVDYYIDYQTEGYHLETGAMYDACNNPNGCNHPADLNKLVSDGITHTTDHKKREFVCDVHQLVSIPASSPSTVDVDFGTAPDRAGDRISNWVSMPVIIEAWVIEEG